MGAAQLYGDLQQMIHRPLHLRPLAALEPSAAQLPDPQRPSRCRIERIRILRRLNELVSFQITKYS